MSGNVVALDRALSQLLVELCVGTVEFGESFVSGNVVALDRALSQLLLELRVGAGEFGECFVRGDLDAALQRVSIFLESAFCHRQFGFMALELASGPDRVLERRYEQI